MVYYRFWPVAWYTYRKRTSANEVVHEVEWSYPYPVDLDAKWEKYRPGLEEESLLLGQRFPKDEKIKEMAFLPPEKVNYRVIFSAGDSRKEFEFPVALRYKPLLEGGVSA